MAVMRAESGCNPTGINGQDNHKTCIGSYGLMQVACLHFKAGQDKLDPATNIKVAYEVYNRNGGFKPWGAFTNLSYKKFL